jgi:hypothetical protein
LVTGKRGKYIRQVGFWVLYSSLPRRGIKES